MPKIKLTAENYHSHPHPHISNSMVKTYLKSPSLYKRRYIDLEPSCQIKVSDAMKKGSALDELLTNDTNTRYVVNPYDGRTKLGKQFKEDHGEEYLINDAILSDVVAMHDEIAKQPFWKNNLEQRIFQLPLEGEIEGVLCKALPDWIDPLVDPATLPDNPDKWPDEVHRMVDLKSTTVKNMETPRKWMFQCDQMGYFNQAAHFQEIYSQVTGIPKDFLPFYWAIVATDPFEPGRIVVRTYKAPQSLLDEALEETKAALRGIKAKKFDDELFTWDEAEELM